MIFSCSIRFPKNFMNPSLLIAEYCVNVAHFCIHSFVEEHLGSFQHLAIINKVAMNIVEHVSLLYVGASVGYLPRGRIDGHYC